MASTPGTSDDHDREELEHIPWGMLSSELGGSRRFTVGSIVVTVLAVIVAVIVGFAVIRGSTEVVEVAPEGVPVTAAPPEVPGSSPHRDAGGAAVTGETPGDGGAGGPSAPPSPADGSLGDASPGEQSTGEQSSRDPGDSGPGEGDPVPVGSSPSALPSEADLMADLPDRDLRVAAVAAEVFVADHFTVDGLGGDPATGDRSQDEPESDEPGSGSGPAGTGSTWVERSRAFSVDRVGSGRYRVGVTLVVLSTDTEGRHRRSPLRAVTVPVSVDDGDTASVTGLPTPADPPVGAPEIPEPGEGAAAPDDVVATALDGVDWPGADVEATASQRVDDGWRVTVAATDRSGVVFPMAIDVPAR